MTEPSIFDKVKDEVSIEDVAERLTTLHGGKNSRRGRCPINGCGTPARGKAAGRPFEVRPNQGRFKCYSCGERGDVIELASQAWKVTAIEACRELLGAGFEAPPPPAKAREQDDRSYQRKLEMAEEMWKFGRPIAGTLVERYLLSRGILQAVIDLVAPAIRFHPFAFHHWDDQARAWIKAPAMLLRPETPAGPTGGVHATYLLRDGTGRDKGLGKLMWGPQTGADGQPGGVWLVGPVVDDPCFDGTPLLEGEGAESALSLLCIALEQGRMARCVTVLALNRMQGLVETDRDGCMDLSKPRAARNKDGSLMGPAFTWPNPIEQPWPEVIVGVDADMAPIKIKMRTGRGKVVPAMLDAPARADLCGRLATRAWRQAGSKARSIVPPGLQDFNDEWRRRLAAREGRKA
jgi:hypothetical protein